MSTIVKTIVATGVSSGIGFEAVKKLLSQSQPYNFIIGARDIKRTTDAFNGLKYDGGKHTVTILPLELDNMQTVKSFAQSTLGQLGASPIDYLMLNAATSTAKKVADKGPHGSRWIEAYLVNHLSQHYLLHLLRPKLEQSKARVVVVSSGAVRIVTDPSTLEDEMLSASSKQSEKGAYTASKFIQLLGAHWWRRQLLGICTVIAVSPGLIPSTGIIRGTPMAAQMAQHPDAKSVEEGADNVLRAFFRDDMPEDPEQIFLTSWGEFWPKDVYGLTLDKALQEKWSPSQDVIENEEGITA
ncbi:hypothetical protein GGS21DRAFT_491496 [Xylaria nigripes]|nr:hypothetical protein GGS21DRAFT_491496 [Xylaria nigripes]